MTIDHEKLREYLNKKLDMALEVARVRQEVLDNRDLEKDDGRSWAEIDFAEKFLLLECAKYMDELNKTPITN